MEQHAQQLRWSYTFGRRDGVKRLDWGSPKEIRRSVLRTGVSVNDEKKFFEALPNSFVTEYPDREIATTPRPLVVRHGDFITFDSPGKHWLALNPAVAHDMGWTLSNTGSSDGWMNPTRLWLRVYGGSMAW